MREKIFVIKRLSLFRVRALASAGRRNHESGNPQHQTQTSVAMKSYRPLLLLSFSSFLFLLLLSGQAQAQKLTNPTKLFKGIVEKESAPAGEGMVYVYEDPYPKPVTSSRVNPTTGDYSVILDPSHVYRFVVEVIGCYTSEFIISTPAGTNYEELEENFEVVSIPADSLLYNGSLFAEGKNTFADEAALREVLAFLDANPTVIVSIGVGLEKDEVDPVTKTRVEVIKSMFTEMNISTTRIKWERLVGTPVGTYVIKVKEFGFEERSDH